MHQLYLATAQCLVTECHEIETKELSRNANYQYYQAIYRQRHF